MNVNMERFSVNLEEKNVNRGENTDVKYFNTNMKRKFNSNMEGSSIYRNGRKMEIVV